jgi:hypothetical protein
MIIRVIIVARSEAFLGRKSTKKLIKKSKWDSGISHEFSGG